MGISIKSIKCNRLVYFIGIFGAFFILESCYNVKPIQIEVVKPAKIELPKNISNTLVLNASIPKYNVPISDKVQANYFKLDSTAACELTYGVYSLLSESPRFSKLINHNKLYHKPQNQLLEPIDWLVLEQLCYQNKTESVIALEAFKIKDTVISFSTLTENGYIYDNSIVLMCNSFWRIYNSDKKQLVHQWLQRDTIYLNEFSSMKFYRSNLNRENSRQWLAKTITNEVAYKVSNSIAPYWTTVKRDVFLGFSDEMHMAAIFVADNKWKQAAAIWSRYVKNENVKLAAKACHNMALVCEVEGRLDIALVWLEKAINLYPNYISENYKKVIEYRLKEEEILDKQFGN